MAPNPPIIPESPNPTGRFADAPLVVDAAIVAPPKSFLGAADYQVPTQFGIGGILALLTLYSGIFALLKRLDAPGSLYFFLASIGLLVCMGQIVWGGVPRGASTFAGAAVVPLWYVGLVLWEGGRLFGAIVGLPCSVVGGAFVGYAVGTLAAGCFMAIDLLEQTLLRWRGVAVDSSPPTQPSHLHKQDAQTRNSPDEAQHNQLPLPNKHTE